ncbi:MAG: SLOG family protein [Planctomycetota bacterium]|jgi:hypothetical protein
MSERVAIVGSRGYPDLDDVRDYIDTLQYRDVEIITGGARGVDKVAEEYALELGMEVTVFKPDYARDGRRAPLIRNTVIAYECTRLVAFWDGRSGGTMDTVRKTKGMLKPVEVRQPKM